MPVKLSKQMNLAAIAVFDRLLAGVLVVLCLPFWLMNMVGALFTASGAAVERRYSHDVLGRPLSLYQFQQGFFPSSLYLLAILRGQLSFCGVAFQPTAVERVSDDIPLKPGLISLHSLHSHVGLSINSHEALIQKHCRQLSFKFHISLLLRGVLSALIYGHKAASTPDVFKIFGIRIDNVAMKEATDWITAKHQAPTQIGFFVNVNSINLAQDDPKFKQQLGLADKVFADGSGVRLAARHFGYCLKDNVNGTDLLPHLCEGMIKNHRRLYLLGSAPGVAKQAAAKLERQFPGLMIAGHHHGYFDKTEEQAVIDDINRSGAAVLLVALGSPIQEDWLIKHRNQLKCRVALGVGGLLDFYSGNIQRSPVWLRELGMEWVYRLLQEPGKKWRRYVIGNPKFLYKTYFATEEVAS